MAASSTIWNGGLSHCRLLLDPQVRHWLGGVEPAWTLLTFESLQALRQEPSAVQTAMSVAAPDGASWNYNCRRRRCRRRQDAPVRYYRSRRPVVPRPRQRFGSSSFSAVSESDMRIRTGSLKSRSIRGDLAIGDPRDRIL